MNNDKIEVSRELLERCQNILALPPSGVYSELRALLAKPSSWPCWSCKAPVTMANRADADGNCPHCEAELDLEDWPFPTEPDVQHQGEPEDDEIHQLAFEIGDPCDDATGYWFCMEAFDEFATKIRGLYRHPAEQPAPVSADLSHDRAYHNGLQRGFGLCESGRVEQYHEEFSCYQREILSAKIEQPALYKLDSDELRAIPLGLLAAACSAIDKKRDAPNLLSELRRYTLGDMASSASVTVVLPDKKHVSGKETPELVDLVHAGWNACIDEVKRINP